MTLPNDADLPATRPSPEAIMRAIFTQALAGVSLALPPGADAAGLRAGLALDAAILAGLYNEARFMARPKPALRRRTRRPRAAIMGALAVLALVAAAISVQPWRSTARIYAAATTDPAAYTLLRRRAMLGDHMAQFDVATLRDSAWLPAERVVPKDNADALRWYQTAAAAGYPPAEENLGFDYNTGHGAPRDDRLAAHWYALAAAAGLAQAQNSLGYLYQTGAGVPRNDILAVRWFQMAADQGLAVAQNNLGAAYQTGAGTAQNYAAAAQWFRRAAAQGEPNAENRLGFLYYRGLGVPRDAAAARYWFAQAAAQGLAPAQLNLGLLYALGIGVGQDDVTAIKWFLLAQERGDADAGRAMSLLEPPPTPEQLRQAWLAALDWDRQAHLATALRGTD